MADRPYRRRLARSWIGAALGLLLLLAACSPPPEPSHPIVPESTRVADAATLAALRSFDPDSGEMRFSGSTQALRELRLDDVLVGLPTEAAPDGFLRRVHAVAEEGDEVVLQTSAANITEAIHQGDIQASGLFGPDDLLEPAFLAEGVTLSAAVPSAEPRLRERMAGGDWSSFDPIEPAQIGERYTFTLGLDEVLVDGSVNGVRSEVRLTGEFHFNAGYGIDVSLRPCWDLPPVCLRRFEASVGFEQTARLRVQGDASTTLNVEKLAASIGFKPLVIMVGPVPVVFTPRVEVYVGGGGQVRLAFDYGVTERFAAQAGVRWTSSNGWQDISEFGLHFDDYDEFHIDGTFRATVHARAEAQLMLYGLVGPAALFTAGVELDAAIPRDPTWRVRGFLRGQVAFIVRLPIAGKLAEYRADLFDLSIDGRSAPNTPPEVTVRQARLRVPLRTSAPLRSNYSVRDREDGTPAITVSSSRSEDQLLPNTDHRFTTVGVRQITVEAVDSRGARTTRSFTVDVYNPPPTVFAAVTADSIRQSGGPAGYLVPLTMTLGASDPVDGRLGCEAITVEVSAPDTVDYSEPLPGICEAEVHFYVQGQRQVRAYATDADGASSQVKAYTLEVLPPPVSPPPVFDGGIRIDGRELPPGHHFRCLGGSPLGFSVVASDPSDLPLSYTWLLGHVDIVGQSETLLPSPAWVVAFPSRESDVPYNPIPDWVSQQQSGGPWVVTVFVSNGETAVSRVTIVSWGSFGCVN